jgi:hypothetical protein
LVTVVVFFVVTPAVVVAKNDKMASHSAKLLASFAAVKWIVALRGKWIRISIVNNKESIL